eukprot:CAMPEP_0204125708 /NCGR_PEP_ID=MMETSP0361-20130328/10590_1 /ASSEMBLY_ACC=CAM_ASM_000343 /TAXON_ID=268821 /ORGANISM="Scrippsiella Hangoei, Strain SHTV-5" /LENGTH=116 /DNA_ID=CAMNT_0051077479 /DNA_START=207 /DNA_END=553 /DNA_ORIENTATION=-
MIKPNKKFTATRRQATGPRHRKSLAREALPSPAEALMPTAEATKAIAKVTTPKSKCCWQLSNAHIQKIAAQQPVTTDMPSTRPCSNGFDRAKATAKGTAQTLTAPSAHSGGRPAPG